ncbi:succinate dehydrogenase assembly factor 4, mitochondrial-like isoform X1 [Onthophagus taurus]|uniref:succinate dehydrogenase assembly factor 4, mitochondrial-like isoform X1 n=1 Tax=Onthophagus taurus TaxID=166361 RepID=UPI0039BE47C4
MSIMMYMLRRMQGSPYAIRQVNEILLRSSSSEGKPLSPRMKEFKQKLRETSHIKSLEDLPQEHPEAENSSAFDPWPDNTNPHTGEIGGPTGPEPTRYGDWERKGRVSDF